MALRLHPFPADAADQVSTWASTDEETTMWCGHPHAPVPPADLRRAVIDLIPLAGATIAGIIIGVVAFIHSITAGIVVVVFFVVYQQIENHFLQPVVYSRTVQLSPLVVLIAILVGAKVAGILGALGAIPVAGAIQVLVIDWQQHRKPKPRGSPAPEPALPGEVEPEPPTI